MNKPPTLAGRRILVVEDEYVIAAELEHCLEAAGAEIEGPWPSSEQALAALSKSGHAIDAAILDVNLGRGGMAYPVAERLDSLGIPYLFTTGTPELDLETFRSRPRLEKPVTSRVLVRAVVELLAGRSYKPRQ